MLRRYLQAISNPSRTRLSSASCTYTARGSAPFFHTSSRSGPLAAPKVSPPRNRTVTGAFGGSHAESSVCRRLLANLVAPRKVFPSCVPSVTGVTGSSRDGRFVGEKLNGFVATALRTLHTTIKGVNTQPQEIENAAKMCITNTQCYYSSTCGACGFHGCSKRTWRVVHLGKKNGDALAVSWPYGSSGPGRYRPRNGARYVWQASEVTGNLKTKNEKTDHLIPAALNASFRRFGGRFALGLAWYARALPFFYRFIYFCSHIGKCRRFPQHASTIYLFHMQNTFMVCMIYTV